MLEKSLLESLSEKGDSLPLLDEFEELHLDATTTAGIALLAVTTAAIPALWMSLLHPDNYGGLGPDPLLMAAALAYAFAAFVGTTACPVVIKRALQRAGETHII